MTRAAVFIAEGFGLGRLPFAPGTFGSLLGVLWFLLLLSAGNWWLFMLGSLAGLAAAVWLCGVAEKELRRADPGSVVLDEIAALPLGFLGWMWVNFDAASLAGGWKLLLTGRHAWMLLIVFVLFRVFDILKPWPIRPSQNLPGGWGVVADDVLAALLTAAVTGWIAARWFATAGANS